MKLDWWKDAIIYQIYPLSFCDSNGDGIGDLKGIISKLDYIKDLGVDCVWLNPVYDSPQKDNGYDIADYKKIWPTFGDLDDFKILLNEMHKRGIRLIMDLVVNHTSNQHHWFQEAIKGKNNPYRDYYIFKDGKGNNLPPNNWEGFFSGSVWEKEPNGEQYYLHLFAKEQPDLNWENPKVIEEVKNILRYWLDMGVDGFRCDVINLISKTQDYSDRPKKEVLTGSDAYINGPRVHEFIKDLNSSVFSKYDCMTVGETVDTTTEIAKELTGKDRGELNMIFNFDHTQVDNKGNKWHQKKPDLRDFKRVLGVWQTEMFNVGWNSLVLENHDQRRSVGRWCTSMKYPNEGAKALATSMYFMQGTPFIYQGQELGMTNCEFNDISEHRDIETIDYFNSTKNNIFLRGAYKKAIKLISRDNARTPMQWDDSKYAGFSNTEPWIKVNPNKNIINVEKEIKDKNSVLNYYKELIRIRKQIKVVKDGTYVDLLPNSKSIYCYKREDDNQILYVVTSFSKRHLKNPIAIETKGFELVLSNYKNNTDKLNPYETRVYLKNKN